MANREEWENKVFESIMKLQDQVLQNMETIAKLQNEKLRVRQVLSKLKTDVSAAKKDPLDPEVIAAKTFDIIKKITEEKLKNGNIHKSSSKQVDKAAIRGTCYILLRK